MERGRADGKKKKGKEKEKRKKEKKKEKGKSVGKGFNQSGCVRIPRENMIERIRWQWSVKTSWERERRGRKEKG